MPVIIGVTSGWEDGQFVQDWPIIYASKNVVDRLEKAGAIPVILPIVEDVSMYKHFIEMLDGIVITGEILSVKRNVFEEISDNVLEKVNPLRYRNEKAAVRAAMDKDIPILSICRGYQVLNVEEGGTMFDDDITVDNSVEHHQTHLLPPEKGIHPISIKEGTKLHTMLKEQEVLVNSYHRQALKKIPAHFTVSAVAPDGHIEAIESSDDRFIIGMQFHPEMLEEAKWESFFQQFVDIVKEKSIDKQ